MITARPYMRILSRVKGGRVSEASWEMVRKLEGGKSLQDVCSVQVL